MDTKGRKELFRAVVGSHNYNLNTVESDRDYKVFIAPTFDDLYLNKSFSSSHIGETEDYDIHDIRKVSELWWKSNINFIEVLFSEYIVIAPDLRKETKDLIMSIFKDRDALVSMNLPYLYNACIGMHLNKMKLLEKGTSGTMHLVERYSYDTKQALHAYRVLDFLKRYADNDFLDFKKAIWYSGSDREFLLDLKSGKYEIDEYKDKVSRLLDAVRNDYEGIYGSKGKDDKAYETLIETVKLIVKKEL